MIFRAMSRHKRKLVWAILTKPISKLFGDPIIFVTQFFFYSSLQLLREYFERNEKRWRLGIFSKEWVSKKITKIIFLYLGFLLTKILT